MYLDWGEWIEHCYFKALGATENCLALQLIAGCPGLLQIASGVGNLLMKKNKIGCNHLKLYLTCPGAMEPTRPHFFTAGDTCLAVKPLMEFIIYS